MKYSQVIISILILLISSCSCPVDAHERQNHTVFSYHIDRVKVRQVCVAVDTTLVCHFMVWKPLYGGWSYNGTESYDYQGSKIIDTFELNDKIPSNKVYTNSDF